MLLRLTNTVRTICFKNVFQLKIVSEVLGHKTKGGVGCSRRKTVEVGNNTKGLVERGH